MDFSQALKELRNGKAIKIRGNKGYFTLDKDNNIINYDGAGGQATRCSLSIDEILSDKWETSGYNQEDIKYSSEYDEIKMFKEEIEKYKAEKFYLEGQISILREMLGK
jgi:hypothetical protein